jgi:hypothetical protein
MVALLGGGRFVHHDFGRADDFLAPLITALEHGENRVVGLGGIPGLGKGLMAVRVKGLPDQRLAFHPVLTEQLLQLGQRHLDALMERRGIARRAGSQGAFEVVNDRQQFNDERFLLRGRPGLAFLPAAPLEIFKVGEQAQMEIFLFGKIFEERVRLGGSGPDDELRFQGGWGWGMGIEIS